MGSNDVFIRMVLRSDALGLFLSRERGGKCHSDPIPFHEKCSKDFGFVLMRNENKFRNPGVVVKWHCPIADGSNHLCAYHIGPGSLACRNTGMLIQRGKTGDWAGVVGGYLVPSDYLKKSPCPCS